ncbi:long-chain fatty acid--CoA ligase [Actinomadura sp. ATCC 31491]|uniref:Long-chain fatty acid--CoA ligase n=1 Tax=Actinomadura luzonensis TaxID=2805427 RepID=A0ABT0FK40_9ACTN|nr:AMP-binding protein [Actinomadura luzonensis]MCK2212664.1 long-chain fatty acid--CoA ligase [Actinomadura luzonensis]
MKPTVSTTGTVINEVFRRAYERGDRPALVDLRGGHVYGYRRLVTEVTRAASGLVRRGARRDQVVGVHVSTAGAQTLAVHTVLAAGGVAAPLDPALGPDLLADRLRGCDARTLITTPDLAGTATLAAEASRVRQVVSLGAALDAIDFRALLTLEPTALPAVDARRQSALLLAGGRRLSHAELLAGMAELDRPVRLGESDVVLTTQRPGGGADLVALVGLALSKGALVVAAGGLDLPGLRHDFGVTVTVSPEGTLERVG